MTFLTCFCAGEQTRSHDAGRSEAPSSGLGAQHSQSSTPQEMFVLPAESHRLPLFPSLLSRNRFDLSTGMAGGHF